MRFFFAISDSLVKMQRESWKLKIFLRGNHSIFSSKHREHVPMNEMKQFRTFPSFLQFFLVCWPEFQGHFLYIGIFSTTARKIGMKIGHELASTYLRVVQAFYRPSDNFHFY